MGVQVTFSAPQFFQLFPQFQSSVSDLQLTNVILPLAEQYVRNDGGGPVESVQSQTNLLNLAVAHICQLFYGANGQTPSALVGRISDATQGSVSVSVDMPEVPGAAWYMQTPFGAALWQAMAPYRTARYLARVNPTTQGFVQYPLGAGGRGWR